MKLSAPGSPAAGRSSNAIRSRYRALEGVWHRSPQRPRADSPLVALALVVVITQSSSAERGRRPVLLVVERAHRHLAVECLQAEHRQRRKPREFRHRCESPVELDAPRVLNGPHALRVARAKVDVDWERHERILPPVHIVVLSTAVTVFVVAVTVIAIIARIGTNVVDIIAAMLSLMALIMSRSQRKPGVPVAGSSPRHRTLKREETARRKGRHNMMAKYTAAKYQ
jgi:hypothetical protein